MGDERWFEVKQLLDEALDLTPDARRAFLERVCGDDLALKAEVEAFLAHDNTADGFMETPAVDGSAPFSAIHGPPEAAPPQANEGGSSRKTGFFWVAAAAGVVFLVLAAGTTWKATRYFDEIPGFGWSTARAGGVWRVTQVASSGPATLLRPGDAIQAFNGDSRAGAIGPEAYALGLTPGSAYNVRVLRGQQVLDLALTVGVEPASVGLFVLYLMLAVSFCGMGMILGFSRPADRITQVGCLAGCAAGARLLELGASPFFGVGHGVALILDHALSLASPWHLALGYHFFYLFSLRRSRPWAALALVFYVVCALKAAVTGVFSLAALGGAGSLIQFQYAHPAWSTITDLLHASSVWGSFDIVVFGAFCGVVLRGYFLTHSPDHRRRFRWVAFGCVSGLLPLLLVLTSRLALWGMNATTLVDRIPWTTLIHAADACLAVLPASLAYAVVKYRVMEVSIVIRLGLQYLIARRLLEMVLLLPPTVLVFVLLEQRERTVQQLLLAPPLYLGVSLPVAWAVMRRYREPLMAAVDRRFFREANDRETLLRATLTRVREARRVEEVARIVSEAVDAAFHPMFICVLSRQAPDGPFAISHTSASALPHLAAQAASAVAQILASPSKSPFDVWTGNPSNAGPALAVAIRDGDNRPTGVLLLGARRSEEPYGGSERDLLQGIADQIGLALRILFLESQLDDDSSVRLVAPPSNRAPIELLPECPECGTCYDAATAIRCLTDGAQLIRRVPRELANRYRLLRRIGLGGMGAVYEAIDRELQRRVAIKVTRDTGLTHLAARSHSRCEARAIARLNHAGIVTIFDVGRFGEDGAYIVMELVEGQTWRAELGRRVLSLRAIAAWMSQLLDVLEAAHAAGVLHRDLKPENVLVTAASGEVHGRLKVVDFGLAALVTTDAHQHRLTIPNSIVGTLGYMSPEQLRGEACDERTDLFTAGIMAIEAISGIEPWTDSHYGPASVELVNRRLPAGLKEADRLGSVLRMCVALDPSDRFPTAASMSAELVPALLACAAVAVD